MNYFVLIPVAALMLVGCGKKPESPEPDSESSSPQIKPTAPVEPQPENNVSAANLFEASIKGNLEAVRAHIDGGTDLNQSAPGDAKKNTPLMLAALFGQTEVVQALIAAKVNLDLVNGDGNTALSTAAFLCHVEVVEALLKAGADKNVKNAGGATAYASVAGDFEEVRFIYDILNNAIFKPMGQPLDYQRIQTSRPKIAAMLE